jgi:hypothetical protein
VLLADPETFEVRHGAVAAPGPDGTQTFRIRDVGPGSYLLVSGSDADNDDFICDAGESCGIYRGPGDVVLIQVDGADIAGLKLTSGYDLATTTSQSLPSSGQGFALHRGARPGAWTGRRAWKSERRRQDVGITTAVATIEYSSRGPSICAGSWPASSAKWRACASVSTLRLKVPTMVTSLPPASVGTKKL